MATLHTVNDDEPSAPPFLERRVEELLETVAARTPAPAGGSVAALVVALAAALAEMAAGFSRDWDGAEGGAAAAGALRARAEPLVQRDAEAYGDVLEAKRRIRVGGSSERARLVAALDQAAEVPLLIAVLGADVARLGAEIAECGNPNLRGDAAAAAALADAATRTASLLVSINLGGGEGDERVQRARELAADAAEAAARAFRAAPPG